MTELLDSPYLDCSPENKTEDKIFLLVQFFISANEERNKELRECLRRNVELFDQIILLNERIYSDEELGVSSPKIQQYNVSHRLKINDIFWTAKLFELKGYIVFGNLDIFFDESLYNLRKTSLHEKPSIMCQLRHEYIPGKPLEDAKLFSFEINKEVSLPNISSQDIWILHSNHIPLSINIDYHFGILGIDNVIAKRFHTAGYKIYNDPIKIKIYHYHSSEFRTYTQASRIQEPYLFIMPRVKLSTGEITDASTWFKYMNYR